MAEASRELCGGSVMGFNIGASLSASFGDRKGSRHGQRLVSCCKFPALPSSLCLSLSFSFVLM